MNKLMKLAERFERKLSKYAQQRQPQVSEGGNPQVVRDAFFGSSTGAGGKSQEGFAGVNPPGFIYGPNSAFQLALQKLPATAKFNIGVTVDVPRGRATFTGAPPALAAALVKDYTTYFGKVPIERIKDKISGGIVSSNLVGSAPGVVVV